MNHKRETEQRLDRAIDQIRESRISDDAAEEITQRVQKRLESSSGSGAEAAEVGTILRTIRGCADYQTLIPAHLAGSLPPSRALLLEEHSRNCVPCRRALNAARSGAPSEVGSSAVRGPAVRSGTTGRWLAIAAMVVAALGTGFWVWNSGPALPYGAVVEAAGAGLYRAATLERLEDGAHIAVGEEVRAAPGQSSVLVLPDGSKVEVRGRSALAIESARKGMTLRVERGSVIVEAAPQGSGRLFVSTDDCLVSVKGTIFAVSHGTRGSRIAVIEGEVKVDYAGAEQTLLAGDRTATYSELAVHAVQDDIAWSQGLDRYLGVLKEIKALRGELASLPRPGLRYSSRLLELAPDDMIFYAAFPNLVDTLIEADRIVKERVAESEVLRSWWKQHQGGAGLDAHMELTAMLSEAGSFLGEEIVVTGAAGAPGSTEGIDGPLILAEITDPQAIRSWFEGRIGGAESEFPSVHFIENLDSPVVESEETLFVWLGADTLVAGPRGDLVRKAAGRTGLATAASATGLKGRLAEVYRGGAETLIALDTKMMIEQAGGLEDPADLDKARRVGLTGASHLIFQQKRLDGRTDNSAVLAFDGPREGVAGWLAEPAPMGSLRYISPDAKLAAAAVLLDPSQIVDQILAMVEAEGESASLDEMQAKLGLDIKSDLAAALGGEFAVALDGPVVPVPAWKLIAEVYDRNKLVWALKQVTGAINDERLALGLAAFEWTETEAGGRTYFEMNGERPLVFTFDEGYLVAAGSRGLVDRAIRYRQSGYTLESSAAFRKLLPPDGQQNFSAFVYQDALRLIAPFVESLGQSQMTDEQRAALQALQSEAEPTLAYAYAEESRIVFAAQGIFDLLSSGLPGLIGVGGLSELIHQPEHHAPAETSAGQEA